MIRLNCLNPAVSLTRDGDLDLTRCAVHNVLVSRRAVLTISSFTSRYRVADFANPRCI